MTKEEEVAIGAAALDQLLDWVRGGLPCCHVRFNDGEFWSIMGRSGPNADRQEHLPLTLGRDLATTLHRIATEQPDRCQCAGYWDVPTNTEEWLRGQRLAETIPWVRNGQAFVDGIESGQTLALLKAIVAAPGRRFLVANNRVCQCAAALRAEPMIIRYGGAYEDMPSVEGLLLRQLQPGDFVLWAAGLGCKPTLYRLWRDSPGTSAIDIGCLFDLAVGMITRTWMTPPPDKRQQIYLDTIKPWLLGETK